jgi:hypothetical protein
VSDPRSLDAGTREAVERLGVQLEPFWSVIGRPLSLVFPAMGARRDVVHGLGTKPDGFLVVYADADIIAEPGVLWTRDLAFLQAGADNAHAIVIFYTLRETPQNA